MFWSLFICRLLSESKLKVVIARVSDPVLEKNDPGLCPSNVGRLLKFYCANMLDNSKTFCFHTFGFRHSTYDLDPENQSGSAKIRNVSGAIQRTSNTKSMNIKKKVFKSV